MTDFFSKWIEGANKVLDVLDDTLPAPQEQGPHAPGDDLAQAWEDSWTKGEVGWAMCRKFADNGAEVMDGYHAFRREQPEGGPQAVCSTKFKPEHVGEVKVLDHGRRLTICTSCIIGVTK